MHIHVVLEKVIEWYFLRPPVPAILQSVDKELLLPLLLFSSWSCAYIKRITASWDISSAYFQFPCF